MFRPIKPRSACYIILGIFLSLCAFKYADLHATAWVFYSITGASLSLIMGLIT